MALPRSASRRRLTASGILFTRQIHRPYSSIRYPPEINLWSHPPSTAEIADDEVSRIAASPMRALTLADLVRYSITSYIRHCKLMCSLEDMGSLHCPNKPFSPPPISPSLSSLTAWPIEFNHYGICHSSSSPTPTFQESTITTFTHCPPFSLGSSAKSRL
jgi:hypothetical protein